MFYVLLELGLYDCMFPPTVFIEFLAFNTRFEDLFIFLKKFHQFRRIIFNNLNIIFTHEGHFFGKVTSFNDRKLCEIGLF